MKTISAVLLSMLALATPAFAGESTHAKMGINLAGPSDWNTELPFVDVFRMSRRWISQQEGKSWGQGPALKLDEHGWVTSLEPDCWAETPVNTIDGGHYPEGDYTLLYDGSGRIEAWGGGDITARADGRLTLTTNGNGGAIFIRLKQTDPADYVRNIRIIMPGFEQQYTDNPWHPAFLARWKGIDTIRFMDFMHTNNSDIAHWSDRPVPEDATFSEKGVALETMIDLANRLNANPWFCIPHKADDDYVLKFALTVREKLNPDLKVYVEYSNEVWNGIFSQNKYAGQQGIARDLGPADKPWEAAWHYTTVRSVEIFVIFEDVFGGTDRLVRILPTQAANPYVAEQIVSFQDAYKHADALAIAPYCGLTVSPNSTPNVETVAAWTVDQVLDYLQKHSLPNSIEWMKKNKDIAEKYGLDLICYEAGQHMVGSGSGENNETLTQLLHRANAHAKLGEIYDAYYDAWQQLGGGLICHFSSVSQWSKWGSWGLVEYYDSPSTAKYRSTVNWANRFGQNLTLFVSLIENPTFDKNMTAAQTPQSAGRTIPSE